jgi:hypothetical protein
MEQFVSRGEFNAIVPSDTSADNKLVNDDTVNDIWKVQGELGAKNLLAYPYTYTATNPFVMNGITYTFNDDGSINMNGSNTSYSTCHLHRAFELYPHGDYIISCEGLIQGVELQFGYVNGTTFYGKASATYAKPSKQFSITNEFDGYQLGVRIIVNPNTTVDNITLHPMIRLASDADDTWQPYAPTNYQLNQKVDTIAGVYLPNATNTGTKKVVASVGQTSVTFDANSFMTRYNVTASDLDLDISAETSSGDIVSYNNVNITGGIVIVTFDALAEQTTFICKCSVIQ